MGIPTEGKYGNDCDAAFDPGMTPKKLWLTTSGILKGSGWTVDFGEPPNGVYYATQLQYSPCQWQGWTGAFQFLVTASAFSTRMLIYATPFGGPPEEESYSGEAAHGSWYSTNEHLIPFGRAFYGGACWLNSILNSNSPSIRKIADALNIEPSPFRKSHLFNISSTEEGILFASPKYGDNIKIKFEP